MILKDNEKELDYVSTLKEIQEKSKFVFKKGLKQIAVFNIDNQIFAIDNRCPHEGYPLDQGSFNDSCILTCNWHNWKFN